MNKLMIKIPDEIINIIISYTYQIQPNELRKDIISYISTKNIIKKIFIERLYPLFYINHLIFHIHGYLKGMPPIYSNCNDKLIEICCRNFIKHKKNVYKIQNLLILCSYNFSKQKLHYIFNTYWGLLKLEERNKFIEIQINMDKLKIS